MEDLQLVLFVLGAIAIIAVLVHGFWSIRKQQPRSIKSGSNAKFKSPAERRDADGFDADGIGAVRVRKMTPPQNAPQAPTAQGKGFGQAFTRNKAAAPDVSHGNAEQTSQDFSLSDSPTVRAPKARHDASRQEPVLAAHDVDETRQYAMEEVPEQVSLFDDVDDFEANELEAADYSPEDVPQTTHNDREPRYAQQAAVVEEAPLPEPRDVLVLHVVAKDGEQLNGAELLPCMLTLNFKFGDMDIFHRHEDNAGNGKVLFSIANMLKPGVFDPDNMEQFTTQGVVMFMTLPCHGDALMNFSIMLNSAYQLADDLGAQVLDGQRQPWDNDTKQDYLRRIRAQTQ